MCFAQNTLEVQVLDEESGKPLPGATIFFPQLGIGASADESGFMSLSGIPSGSFNAEVRFIGYETQLIQLLFPLEKSETLIFKLEHMDHELEALYVQSNRSSRLIEDIPTRVEIIAGEELAEKGNMKPGDIRMLLNESTGIQTQQTSATSYNSSIRIQGLDGKYTQLLRDGLPLYSGFSSGLSLMQIAPLDLAQVEVIKGSSSTLYGGGAIAGLVNLITKRPAEEPEFSFLLNGTSALGLDASAFFSSKGKKLGTTIFASYNKGRPYDPADIGFTAIPEFDRFTLNPRFFIDFRDKSSLVIGVNYTQEDRLGGNISFIEGSPVANPYYEANKTDRFSTELIFNAQWPENRSFTVKNSFSIYNREIEIPDYHFNGEQISSFSEIGWSSDKGSSLWATGLNLWTDQFDQFQGDLEKPLDYSQITAGAFVQNIWNSHPNLTLETGFRLDYLSTEGIFPLPKLSIMYKPTSLLTVRIGGGMGYKSPTVFTEEAERIQFKNVLQMDDEELKSERSIGANLDINYRLIIREEFSLVANGLVFFTQIQNPILLEETFNNFVFTQPDGKLETRGIEINLIWRYHDFKLFTGYTFADVVQVINNKASSYPLVARYRLNNVLMYEKHDNFWIGLEGYYFSSQLLNDGGRGQSYWILGLMTEKVIGEHLSIYVNFENFLDTRQSKFGPIYIGDMSTPSFKEIYAPVDGFVVNGGIKLKF